MVAMAATVTPVTFSIASIVRSAVASDPWRPVLTFEDQTMTWADLDERAGRVAHALLAEGVGPQDRVAFLDKNGPAYFEVLFGGSKINAVNVAVNWRLAPTEVAYVVNDAEAKVLFVGPDFVEPVASIEDQLGTVRRVVVLQGDHPKYEPYERWLAGQPATDPGVESAPGDVAMQLYTSGTTGQPKGVMLTNTNFDGIIGPLATELGLGPSAVSLVAMPLFHIGGSGWALVGMANGAHSVVVREVDPAAILQAIAGHRVTHAFLVPAVLMFMLATPGCADIDFSSLHTIAYGASPISEDVLLRSLSTFGCGLVQLYGMTETTGAITALLAADHDPGGPHADRLRSCGRPLPGVEIRLVDPATGRDCPTGAVGELWVRTTQNMRGYWKQPEETARTINADGWLRTGDAGYFDADGYLYLHDRVKDMIVTGGENVYPAEVENVLMAHPGIADVAVIGVPSETWGETVKAVVVPAPGVSLAATPEDIIAFARERLAHFKCPKSVDFVEVLPRNPSGKVLKRELREPYWRGVDRRIH